MPESRKPRKSPSKSPKKPKSVKEEAPADPTFTGTAETDPALKEESTIKGEPDANDGKSPGGGGDPTRDEKVRKGLLKMVDEMCKNKYMQEFYPFKYKDTCRVLVLAKECFAKEPVCVECRLPIVVVGDIHGQYPDLQRVFTIFSEQGRLGCFNQRFVFLGDYVDRGKQSMECIMLVLVLKILFPGEYVLLRGNHEMRPINMVYGFLDELKERFERKQAKQLFEYFNQVFSFMPLCCIAGDQILCMHGGICPEMTSREVFKEIPKPLKTSNEHIVAESLLWADPMYGEPRARPNQTRGLAVHFGEPLVDEICEKLNVKLIVRGHQMMMNGFKFFSGHKLVTVFTASHYYPDKLNHGAVMVVDATGRCGFRVIAPSKSSEEKVFRGEHEEANKKDNGYQTNPDVLKAQMLAARAAREAEYIAGVRKSKSKKKEKDEE